MADRRKRTNIKSTPERPRLVVSRSNDHLYAQVIDDVKGVTLASASSYKLNMPGNVAAAIEVGKLLAEELKKQSIKKVVFDRGRFLFTGRVKAFAKSVVDNGVEI